MEDRFAPSEPIVESEAAQDKAEEEKYWGPIRRIDHSQIIDLAKNATKNPTSEWRVIKEPRGAFNQSYIVESDSQQRLNVRVPACGFHPRWNEVDAKLLHDTALGMEWIRQRTGLPIPELVSYDASLNNEIGAPYILMSYINGKPLNETWPGNGDDPAEVHEQRLKVLRQLSRLVVKFSSLQFDRFGALTFPIGDNENPGNPKDPIIDEALRLKDSNIFTIHRKFFGLPVDRSLAELVATRKEYAESVCEEKRRYHEAVAAAKNLRPRSSASVESKNKSDVVAGYHCLWAMMQDAFLAVARLGANEPEFALMQSDFNPQNILVNEDHEIVGLIDFDCTEAIPRQMAWCCVPHWLAADWNDDYMWPAEGGVLQHMSPEEFGMYRVEYCRLLREACEHDEGLSDHRFSSKSHIYRSLLSSYEDFDKIKGFVSNVMAEILPRNVKSLDSYAERIGKVGLQKGEEAWLQRRLEEYLRPDSCVAAVRTSEAQQDSPPAGGQRAGGRALE
ncbi:uncharacterized protein MYCFIDRAFT_81812 [Pseudocercospora fijiensis CIRAD86]|uniref:Aminoglycoside phosphotransferase domain-containing protein n=1 Tax=Pseudocercospora fijiensis (strain CIRAD86) TaxID=383855 RepID=M3B1S5_PSEFD|nr:uncharacterized protein MYCFIDRAFT_81812 [Pseudocercospora fijiensis CIRAD86]EME83308.1 hypothetical protein MYCFIDRAFT_81812 [Pseudocercospora fijiensis CIRAD86]